MPLYTYGSILSHGRLVKSFLGWAFPAIIPPMPDRDLMTKAETTEYLRISRGMMDRLMKRRDIPFAKIGKKVLFRKADVDKWLESKIVK